MKQRILAFLIDHLIGTLIFGIVFMATNWNSIVNPTDSNFMKPFETFNIILVIGMIYYLLKDIYQGRSIGKRVSGIAVRDVDHSNVTPGILRLLIRNITIFLWPIELIILVLTQRRIGDLLARTQIKNIRVGGNTVGKQ